MEFWVSGFNHFYHSPIIPVVVVNLISVYILSAGKKKQLAKDLIVPDESAQG